MNAHAAVVWFSGSWSLFWVAPVTILLSLGSYGFLTKGSSVNETFFGGTNGIMKAIISG